MNHRKLTVYILILGFTAISCADQRVVVVNSAPRIIQVQTCYDDSRPKLRIVIRDLESDPVDISLRLGDQSQSPWIFPGNDGVGLVGLASSPAGTAHFIEWGPCPESPSGCPLPAVLRATEPAFESQCPCAEPPTELEHFPAEPITLSFADKQNQFDSQTVDRSNFSAETTCTP